LAFGETAGTGSRRMSMGYRSFQKGLLTSRFVLDMPVSHAHASVDLDWDPWG
jgi:hypothetical protein